MTNVCAMFISKIYVIITAVSFWFMIVSFIIWNIEFFQQFARRNIAWWDGGSEKKIEKRNLKTIIMEFNKRVIKTTANWLNAVYFFTCCVREHNEHSHKFYWMYFIDQLVVVIQYSSKWIATFWHTQQQIHCWVYYLFGVEKNYVVTVRDIYRLWQTDSEYSHHKSCIYRISFIAPLNMTSKWQKKGVSCRYNKYINSHILLGWQKCYQRIHNFFSENIKNVVFFGIFCTVVLTLTFALIFR